MLRDIDFNDIALFEQGYRPPFRGLWGDVPNGRAPGGARKTPVGDESDAFVEFHARQSRGGSQHFAHTGAALGALVADDHNVPRRDFTVVYGVDRLLFRIKDPGRAGVDHHLGRHRALLDDAAVPGDVAPQNGDASGGAVGVREGADHLRVSVDGVGYVVSHGFPRGGHGGSVDVTGVRQLFYHGRKASRLVEVLNVVMSGGSKVTEVRDAAADGVDFIEIQGNLGFVGDGQKMQHAVGGAPQGHIHRQRVLDGFFVDDVPRLDVPFQQFHHLHARAFGELCAGRVDGRYRSVTGKGDAHGLGQAVHGVGRVHAGTGAASGAGGLLHAPKFRVVYQSALERAHGLEVGVEVDGLETPFGIAFSACQHGAAGDEDGGDVEARRGHDHPRNDLVAVGDQNEAVHAVGGRHGLHRIGDQLTGSQGIPHAAVSHDNPVAHADHRHQDRRSPRHIDPRLGGLGEFVQVDVTGNDLAEGIDHADQRTAYLFRGKTAGVE